MLFATVRRRHTISALGIAHYGRLLNLGAKRLMSVVIKAAAAAPMCAVLLPTD